MNERDDHCHQCDRAKGSTVTETVDGRGPGWKCVCGWWNWLDAAEGTATHVGSCRIHYAERTCTCGADGGTATPERRTQIVKVYHVDEGGVSKCEAMYGPYTVEEALDWETKINRQMKHDHVYGFVVVDQLSEGPW